MRDYERRDPDSIAGAHSGWASGRQAVAELGDSLNAAGRGAPGYAAAYARFRAAYNALAREEADLEARMRRELGGDRELARRAAAAADSLRRWEQDAFRDFAALTDPLPAVRLRTDHDGRIRISLPTGRWWLVARLEDPDNPFLELAWNVPVVVSGFVPIVAPLSGRNVTLRWRR